MTRSAAFLLLLAVAAPVPVAVAQSAPAGGWGVAVFPSGAQFSLEIAADPRSRRIGYMFREKIGPREGMLFIFDEVERHSMWMKNCKATLDMIWLDEQFRVVEIASDLQPCPEDGECPAIMPMRASRYVLEVAGGISAGEKLAIGDKLVLLTGPGTP